MKSPSKSDVSGIDCLRSLCGALSLIEIWSETVISHRNHNIYAIFNWMNYERSLNSWCFSCWYDVQWAMFQTKHFKLEISHQLTTSLQGWCCKSISEMYLPQHLKIVTLIQLKHISVICNQQKRVHKLFRLIQESQIQLNQSVEMQILRFSFLSFLN